MSKYICLHSWLLKIDLSNSLRQAASDMINLLTYLQPQQSRELLSKVQEQRKDRTLEGQSHTWERRYNQLCQYSLQPGLAGT